MRLTAWEAVPAVLPAQTPEFVGRGDALPVLTSLPAFRPARLRGSRTLLCGRAEHRIDSSGPRCHVVSDAAGERRTLHRDKTNELFVRIISRELRLNCNSSEPHETIPFDPNSRCSLVRDRAGGDGARLPSPSSSRRSLLPCGESMQALWKDDLSRSQLLAAQLALRRSLPRPPLLLPP